MSLTLLLAQLLTTIVNIVVLIVFVQVIIHWLVAFEVLKVNNPQAKNLVDTLNRFTERLYAPIRKFVPPIGGIDLTPVVVIVGLQFLIWIIWAILV